MQCFYIPIFKSYLQIIFFTNAIRHITMSADPTSFLMCFYIFFLYHDFLFMRGSRIGEPVIPPKKQYTTDSTDTNQMATTINYFIIHCCQPNPSFIERNCCYHYYKCHSNRYPPVSQCIFVYYIGNST